MSPSAAPGAARADVLRRLQLGAIGIAAVLVLIGLASMIQERAARSDQSTVPESVSSPGPTAAPATPDPLAQAGVVPEMPASPSAGPAPSAAAPVTQAPVKDAP